MSEVRLLYLLYSLGLAEAFFDRKFRFCYKFLAVMCRNQFEGVEKHHGRFKEGLSDFNYS